LFIAFSGEEEWLIGSTYFCSHPTIDLEKVNYMYNFDMVGRLGCEGNKITAIGTATSRDWKRIYREMSNHGFKVGQMRGPGFYSDHYPFYKQNLPIAYITTGLHYDYHTPRDIASKINYDGMINLIKYSEEFIARSEDLEKITFKPVSGLGQFLSGVNYFFKEFDYILTVGFGGME
jgi:Zn-dependent M28 family amino/carboxypeptidase